MASPARLSSPSDVLHEPDRAAGGAGRAGAGTRALEFGSSFPLRPHRSPQLASPRRSPPTRRNSHGSEKGRPLPAPITPPTRSPAVSGSPVLPELTPRTQAPGPPRATGAHQARSRATVIQNKDAKPAGRRPELSSELRGPAEPGRQTPQPGGRPIPIPVEPRNRASHAAAGEPAGAGPSLGFVSVSCWRPPGVTEPRRSHRGPSKLRRITEIPGTTACDGRAITLQTQRENLQARRPRDGETCLPGVTAWAFYPPGERSIDKSWVCSPGKNVLGSISSVNSCEKVSAQVERAAWWSAGHSPDANSISRCLWSQRPPSRPMTSLWR